MSIKSRLRRLARMAPLAPAAAPQHAHGERERHVLSQLAASVQVVKALRPQIDADIANGTDTPDSCRRWALYLAAAGASSAYREHLRHACPACAVAFPPPIFAAGNAIPCPADARQVKTP